jgi:succinoglycan biosynthesis transport protein ExoP
MASPAPQLDTPAQQVGDYLRALRRRWKLILLITALVTGAALTASLTSPKQYDAAAQLLLSQSDQAVNELLTGRSSSSSDPERDINTSVELIKLDAIANRVRRDLNLSTPTSDLLDQVTTGVEGTSDLVTITVRDSDPRRAAAIANGFARGYVTFRRTSARAGLNEAAQLAQAQLRRLAPDERTGERGRQLQGRIQELQTAAALQTGGAEVVRNASVPDDPSRPRPLLSAALGLFVGLLLGVVGALIVDLLDRRIRDEDTVEEEFDLPLLTSIPRPARGRDGDDREQREAYGMLGANLRFSSARAESQVLMVTSAMPEEGKTTVSLGLARALAQLGQRVIVLEADLRRPAFRRYVDLPASGGLAQVLAGASELGDELIWLDATSQEPVTLDDLEEGLSFALLPVGDAPLNAQRALASPAMASVLEQARALSDIVIIDTAPIGTVNDAATLIDHVDAALVVSRLNRTTRDAARRTKRVLGNLGVALAGVVVTDGTMVSDGYYHYDTDVEGNRNRSAGSAR